MTYLSVKAEGVYGNVMFGQGCYTHHVAVMEE
jgi:hypothetical protein